jgi:spore coat polysaccharide biosynthesis protein SpsF
MHHAGMRLRQATVADRDLLWRWRNDDEMRAQSFRTTAIPLDEHDRWLHAALADPSCLIWILLDSHGLPVGQGRIRIRGEEAELSLSVAAEQRGQGIGGVLLRLLTDQLFAERPEVVRIRAFVKHGNHASSRLFESVGYGRIGTATIEGTGAWLFERRRTA